MFSNENYHSGPGSLNREMEINQMDSTQPKGKQTTEDNEDLDNGKCSNEGELIDNISLQCITRGGSRILKEDSSNLQ